MADDIVKPAASKKDDWVYKVSPIYDMVESAITISKSGERINLIGKTITQKRDATDKDPRTEVVIRGATQEEMKDHFDGGVQNIIIKVKA
jgi:hypothetical protein